MTRVDLDGDDQADRDAHGGYDKAVYSYADEDRRWWENEIGSTIEHGGFGENLTTNNLDVTGRPGAYLRIHHGGSTPSWRSDHRLARARARTHVGDVARIHRDRVGAERLLAVDENSDKWKAWATRNLDQLDSRAATTDLPDAIQDVDDA